MIDALKIKKAPKAKFKKGEIEQPSDIPIYEIDGIAGVMASTTTVRFNLYQTIPKYPFTKNDPGHIRRICCALSMSVEEFISIYYWMHDVIEDYKKRGIIVKEEDKPKK